METNTTFMNIKYWHEASKAHMSYTLMRIFQLTDGLSLKINSHSACNCISNDQGWRSQVVCSGVGVDSAFKISVPRQDTCSNQVSLKQGSHEGLKPSMYKLIRMSMHFYFYLYYHSVSLHNENITRKTGQMRLGIQSEYMIFST